MFESLWFFHNNCTCRSQKSFLLGIWLNCLMHDDHRPLQTWRMKWIDRKLTYPLGKKPIRNYLLRFVMNSTYWKTKNHYHYNNVSAHVRKVLYFVIAHHRCQLRCTDEYKESRLSTIGFGQSGRLASQKVRWPTTTERNLNPKFTISHESIKASVKRNHRKIFNFFIDKHTNITFIIKYFFRNYATANLVFFF